MSSRVEFPTLLLAGILLVGGCGPAADAADPAAEPPSTLVGPENMFVVETAELQNGPTISGTLAPEREATVRAEIPSSVVQSLVEVGQSVGRGQLLARLNDDAIRDQALSAKSGVRTATEALMVARRNADRSEKLSAAGALSERDLEQARFSATNAEAALADAEARLALANKQLGYTVIRAPISGVVSERQVSAGDNVSAGNPLFTVVDPSSLRLEAQVPVSAVAALKIGTAVPFTIDGLADRQIEGRIIRINPALDPATRQVRVIVALPNKTGRLVAGLFAQGRVAIESRHGIVVPESAIDRRGLRPTVTKLESGIARRIEVALGIEDPGIGRVEVSDGLAVGDTVIIGGARDIQPGTRVRASALAERPAGTSN